MGYFIFDVIEERVDYEGLLMLFKEDGKMVVCFF